ncbi:MAG: hypothetical protein GWN01_03890 [Nitrosopumilaceae archaeon]|nr:hypothetical protein [Nitrosopumilaceae archaeon]NIU00097.1 hypothetical protein [Nitrosopumilaceae archaeon]NIU86487.1 hypothetical protein [Nitrosopumilaceae archaeon]NIV65722.1 hypothetical protein [Nitrosopumilaceae archaeon]NIX60699.1 hypothetical protein [Nitrosopumilaceae archaeon]
MKLPLDPFQFAMIMLVPSIIFIVSGTLSSVLSLTAIGVVFLGISIWQFIVAAIEPEQKVLQGNPKFAVATSA